MLPNVIIVIVLVAIVAGIGLYLYKAKKRGEHCIGCPHAKQCSGRCSNSSTDNLKSHQ